MSASSSAIFGPIHAKLWTGTRDDAPRGVLRESLTFDMTPTDPGRPDFHARFASAYAAELDAFVRSARAGTACEPGVDIGWKTMLVAELAERSSREGGRRFSLRLASGRDPDSGRRAGAGGAGRRSPMSDAPRRRSEVGQCDTPTTTMDSPVAPQADIALIGLAVMGQNLILNMNDHGYTVVAFNRTVSKVDDFLANEARGTNVIGAHSLSEMAALLKRPRRVMLMVKAANRSTTSSSSCSACSSRATSSSTAATRCSRTRSAARSWSRARVALCRHRRLRRRGRRPAWPEHHARRQQGRMGAREADLPGDRGEGRRRRPLLRLGRRGRRRALREDDAQRHRVRRHAVDRRGVSPDEGRPGPVHRRTARGLQEWNEGELDSYLIEITRDIFAKKDTDGAPLVDKILDTAGQKGTGKWTVISSPTWASRSR
jgi:hypothetical protein